MTTKIILALRIVIAIILVQTLYFKFTAHPDSVYIFSKVGLEPFGRIGIGILELISAILILIPRTIWLGALLTSGLMSGAITMHLTQLGIKINNDDGSLFYMALALFLLSSFTLINQRKNIPIIGMKL
ncbi:MAG: DoxX family protein [Flavobacteriaceae bacterium]